MYDLAYWTIFYESPSPQVPLNDGFHIFQLDSTRP